MGWVKALVVSAAVAPSLAACSGGDAVLQRQDVALFASPSSMTFSMSASQSQAFNVTDSAAGPGAIALGVGSCNGIATYSGGASVMTIGNSPGVQPNSPTGGSYSVQALAPGKCTLRITDSAHNVATIFVTVTN